MLEVSLLGPTEARVTGVNVSLSPLERNLLAALALSKGTVLSTERIIDCLWEDRHPASPRSRVQGLVSSLRRKVGEALVTRHPGYLLDINETKVDLDECDNLARRARLARTPAEAGEHLRNALALWRGEPLDGVSAPGIEVDRVRLTELRVGLLEDRFAADLELGKHAELISELTATASAHPLRERLAGQLMLALYRCNRQADALKVYQALRERLADELGSDPCADLRNLHATILRGDQVAPPVPEAPAELRPAQLPAGVGYFTGRDRELAALNCVVRQPCIEPMVVLLSGAGGLGKTALAVEWAHSVASVYSDGQIFVDLHGQLPGQTLSPTAVLRTVLDALGMTKMEIPASIDGMVALYRTLISARRLLIVADDAASVDQVLPLVPPTTASQLVATSRRRMAALSAHHAVQSISIEPLTSDATHDLLARLMGPARLRDPAASRVVQWCGGWPLAIRLAGTKLAARPGQSMESFVEELDESGDDLVLDGDPRSVRAALVSAHQALSPAAAHLFGRLGLCPTSTVRLKVTAAVDDASVWRVRRLLDELIAVNLVVEDGPDRYRIHDVVRRFARRCAEELADRDTIDEWMRERDLADSYRI